MNSTTTPINPFKAAMKAGEQRIGLWLGLADAISAELLAGVGYDWLLIDGEHAPNDIRTVLAQLQAVAAYSSHAIVRPVQGDIALIKQYLDLGAQTLLIPMIESAEQAARMVQAMQYPPHGIRGVGSALARASRWNQMPRYLDEADAQMCTLVQVESQAGLTALDSIANVDGVDGVFFGPADLSASLGLRGQPSHPDVVAAITQGIVTVRSAGKAPGVLATDAQLAQHYLKAGAQFVAVAVDTSLLVRAAKEALAPFKVSPTSAAAPVGKSAY